MIVGRFRKETGSRAGIGLRSHWKLWPPFQKSDGKQGNRGYESGALVATMVALLGSHDVCRRIAVVFQRVGG